MSNLDSSNLNSSSQIINERVYPNYALARKEIASIEPIDYFFAQDLITAFSVSQPQRVELFHLFMALSQSLREGHTCLPLHVIANTQYGYLSDETGVVVNHGFVFSDLTKLNDLFTAINVSVEAKHPIVFDDERLYLRRYFQFEQDLFNEIQLKANVSEPETIQTRLYQTCIDMLFPDESNTTTDIDWQKVAITNALNKNFSVIAGGPGTGKTYTVTKLLAALVYLHQQQSVDNTQLPLKMALVAPTGKAAQRLSESIVNAVNGFRRVIGDEILNQIPNDTHTIHRLLRVIPNSPNFRFNENNKLNIDVLLIDEVSMVDLALMTRVFRALPKQCKVILLGDADQLPSVAAGSVLSDLAPRPFLGYSTDNAAYLKQLTGFEIPSINKSAKAKQLSNSPSANSHNNALDHTRDSVTFLTKSRRFDGEGGIGLIAQAVIAGNYDQSWALLNNNASSERNTSDQITHLKGDLITWLLPLIKKYYLPISACENIAEAFTLFSKFRVLCATRVGEQGVDYLNELITSLIVKKGEHQELYHGRPIIISENNYHQGLYNGDIGFLWKNEAGHLMAVFEDNNEESVFRWIMTSKLPHFETVFAMTIHKTQGSEFSHVAMILPNQKDNRLLSRELLYTGITRAKDHISIASNARVWRQGVETQIKRYSSHSNNNA
ncbi:exodeoxyribonuclease V subunit alpha [Pseudocolwellia sp. HL-MZ7]|uniref:exodeoxyribonuclease V subunit alpha n=1 Tax=Pseudocolwellia sp. HL-MZ7 TaxID=3400627 RepID=UPI003CF85300